MIALLIILFVPLHFACKLLRIASPFPRLFLRGAAWAAGVTIRVDGERVLTHALYIANHVSWLDILTLAGRTGTAFVAKADMAAWPLLGWLASLNNSVYVAREDRLGVNGQASALKDALATGQPLTLFPEGTTGDGTALLPFRSSLIAAVVPPPPGLTIQPVAIDYGDAAAAIAWTGDEAVGSNAMRVLARRGRMDVYLRFLPPLSHDDLPHRKLIAAHSRDAIARALRLD